METSRLVPDGIAREIGIRIVAEELRPGDLLTGEVEASTRLQVSRNAYREAIRILVAKGLVESRTKTGTRVSERQRWHLLDPQMLSWFLETKPSIRFVRDLFEIRMMVEPHAASLAAARRTRAQLEEMERAIGVMGAKSLATEAGREADRAFHRTILRATGNELMHAMSSSIVAAIQWTTLFKHRMQAEPRDPLEEHRTVLEAIRGGDPERARGTMADLVQKALADMERSLDPETARLGR